MILLVSDNKESAQQIAAKIILLRQTDNVVVSDYTNALSHEADIVLLHENSDKTATLKLIEKLNAASIFLLTDGADPKFILEAYDAGACDFCPPDAPDYELVIKIVNAVRLGTARAKLRCCEDLLSQHGLMEDGFFTDEAKQYFPCGFAETEKAPLRMDDIVVRSGGKYFIMTDGEPVFEPQPQEEDQKQFKFFRKIFDKKRKDVIVPAFSRVQEEGVKFTKTKDKCCLKTKKSALEIIYPGLTKVLIRTTHNSVTHEAEVPLPQINQKMLAKLVKDFIKSL